MISCALFAAGLALTAGGLMRGEGATVLAKAVRICFECIGLG
ncbi:MAG: CD1871A family CXXC motif-containing protein [Bacillota bacterium]|nr:CD1871A family CXXC motif-containing protein [Bacillota bacterium]